MKYRFPFVEIYVGLLKYALIILIASFCPRAVISQEQAGQLSLKHADQLFSSGGNGDIVNLVGNVHLTHEGIDLFSQRATWYKSSGLVQFTDSVKAVSEDRTIWAQSLTYYRRDKRLTAKNDVRLIDDKQNIMLHCERADYFRNTRMIEATGWPVLVINPGSDTSELTIKAMRMEYFMDESKGTAYDSVIITRKEMVARGGKADFVRQPESVILTENPILIQEPNQLTGDTISIFTENRKLQRLVVNGHAKAIYMVKPDSAVNDYSTSEMEGKELEAYFENNQISRVITRYNATSFYDPAVTDTITRGSNTASGDSIILHIENGQIGRVQICGGAIGKYIEQKADKEGKAVVDTTIYSGEEIDYSVSESVINLVANSSLKYKNMALEAGKISYDTQTKILSAEGLPGDSGISYQPPVLRQGSEVLNGEKMTYNLETEKGQVKMARTKFDEGYYTGGSIRRISDEDFFVASGEYTSCDKQEFPHYHFFSTKMKMIGKEKVIARPVVLFIGQLPVFAIPYYVFPIRKGRHSGFTTFEIGNFERGNRFIRNLGYYWAASDYWDLESSIDFYENQKTILNGALRYVLRYYLDGSIRAEYSRETQWNRSTFVQRISNRWRVSGSHNQTISNSVSLTASGTFVSDKNYIADNEFDPSERINRTVRSTASLTKRWKSSSLIISADQNWNLDTDTKRAVLPSIGYTRVSLPLFPEPGKDKKKHRVKPGEEVEEFQKRFYHNIQYSFRTSGQNLRQTLVRTDSSFYHRDFQTLNSQGSISGPQTIFGALTMTPSANLFHTVYRLEANDVVTGDSLVARKLATRESYSLSISSSTKIYGTVYPGKFGILGIRHVMTPSAAYSFTPEITKNQIYFTYTGVGAGSRRSKAMTFSLGNLFQTKYLSGDKEKKIDLFILDFSSRYDFTAITRKLGNLSTNLRTSAIPHLDITYSSSHSFYNDDDSRRSLLHPLLTNMSISSSTNYSYRPGSSKSESDQQSLLPGEASQELFPSSGGSSSEGGIQGFDIAISHRYSKSRNTGGVITKTQWLNLGIQLAPTTNWRFTYDIRYDFETETVASGNLSITRDMHCWQGSFVWIPSGPIAGYYLKISIKALPDIKVEKSEGGVRGQYY